MAPFGYSIAMDYTTSAIVEATGVPARTIRLWTERRLLPRPSGKGPGTRYSEEHRVRIRTIVAFRAEGHGLDAIRVTLKDMDDDEMREFIGEPRRTKPTPQAAPPAQTTEPAATGAIATLGDDTIPNGQRWVIVGLLPKLALMVGEDASPLVRRVAAEICAKYAAAL